jgi:predicted  nucleic acid-binding Zn-ribbon protein
MKGKKNRPFVIRRSGWSAFSIIAYLVLGIVLPAFFILNVYLDYNVYMKGYENFVKTDVTATLEKEIDANIDKIQSEIAVENNKIEKANKDIKAEENKITTLESEIAELNTNISGLETQIAEKNTALEELRKDEVANAEQITTLESEKQTLTLKLQSDKKEAVAKSKTVEAHNSVIEQLDNQISDYNNVINGLTSEEANEKEYLKNWKYDVKTKLEEGNNALVKEYYERGFDKQQKLQYNSTNASDYQQGLFGITKSFNTSGSSVENLEILSGVGFVLGVLTYSVALIILCVLVHNARKTRYKFEGNVVICENGKVFSDMEENKRFVFAPGMSVHMEQSLKGWFFRYGTVVISMGMATAGEFRMENVKRPKKVHAYIADYLTKYAYTPDYMSKPYFSHPYAPANMFPHFFGGMFGMGMGRGCNGNGECGCGGAGCNHGAGYPYSSPYSFNGTSYPFNF